MTGTIYQNGLIAMLAAWLLVPVSAGAEVCSRMSTRFLARGEMARLEVAVTDVKPTGIPVIPAVPGVEIRQEDGRAIPRQISGRRIEYVVGFQLSSYDTGRHVVPPLEVLVGGVKIRTEPLEFMVFNPDELQWSEAGTGANKIRYASAFRVMNAHPYEGETLPVEIKIFVPRDLTVEDWGIPDFQRDGVNVWLFKPSLWRSNINLLGQPYVAVAYPSTLTAARAGKVGIGPAALRLMTVESVNDGYPRLVSQEVNLTIQRLDLETKPLPKGAPEGFENAVGSFRLDVRTVMTSAQEGDPIPMDIVVSGTGNLDTLRPPKPVNTNGWKLYEPAADQRGDERRELSGTTVFHQFMRPLELKSAIPSFRLVYFDPKDATYKSVTTEPIPLKMKPAAVPKPDSARPPDALAVPVERMTDILGVLRAAPLTMPRSTRVPGWLGHAVAAWVALGLIARALWLRYGHRLRVNPVRQTRLKELREIGRISKAGDDTGFLMAAGRFIERWLGDHPLPEIKAVLAERDALCFRQEKTAAPMLEPNRRAAILRLLRKAAMAWTLMFLLAAGAGQSRAGDLSSRALDAYDSANYDEAIKSWLDGGNYEDLTAGTLFNIGDACFRAGSPGHAALYYRRALARDPSHQESRQNLRFIERKCGSITVHRPEYQYALAKFPLVLWQGMLWTGIWLCVLAALVFPATRPGARPRVAALAVLIVAPLMAAGGGLGWRYFPNDAEFAPVERQAVIIGEKAVLHADAARSSAEVIDAPAGSLCEVIAESGRWAYVAFATKTRGWLPVEAIERVIPTTPPVPPAIRKPKADGKSA